MNNLIEIKNHLENNKILILKTDTIIGLACNALSIDAINNLYKIKKREKTKSFSIFCKKSDIGLYGKINYTWQRKIIDHFIPGKITLLLDCKYDKFIQNNVTNNKKIGIRIPNMISWINLLEVCDFPLCVTSANMSNSKSALSFSEINKEILSDPNIINKDYFQDSENSKHSNIASSIFDISVDSINQIKEIRNGEIKLNDILSLFN